MWMIYLFMLSAYVDFIVLETSKQASHKSRYLPIGKSFMMNKKIISKIQGFKGCLLLEQCWRFDFQSQYYSYLSMAMIVSTSSGR